jgi:hypothetical protein
VVDSTKIIATRNMLAYYVGYAAGNVLPLNTLAWGTTWGTPVAQTQPWIPAGYTSGGVHFTTEVTRGEIRVDQELDPVLRPATARTATMHTNLAEFTMQNVVTATGQGAVVTTAPLSGTRGQDEYSLGSTVADVFYSFGFDLKAQDNEAIRMVGWRAQPVGSPTFDATPEAPMLIPMNMTLLPDTSTVPARVATIRDIIPALP